MSVHKNLKLTDKEFSEIKIGDTAGFSRLIDEKSVLSFAEISGDFNPLHMDETYANDTQFGGRIAHGMLLAGFFSAIVGMLLPGKRSLYLSQNLKFKNYLKIGSTVNVSGKVTAKSEAARILDLETIITDESGKIIIEGSAKVKMI